MKIIFHDDVYVDADNRFKLIFTAKSNLTIFINIFFMYT